MRGWKGLAMVEASEVQNAKMRPWSPGCDFEELTSTLACCARRIHVWPRRPTALDAAEAEVRHLVTTIPSTPVVGKKTKWEIPAQNSAAYPEKSQLLTRKSGRSEQLQITCGL